jgi:hypothetical protein
VKELPWKILQGIDLQEDLRSGGGVDANQDGLFLPEREATRAHKSHTCNFADF